VLTAMLAATGLQAQDQQPPNVLFLAIDDLNTWLLDKPERYAGKVIAPNLAKLAQSGVRFMNNHTTSPACSPSRFAVMTGKAPWTSGVYGNGYETHGVGELDSYLRLPQFLKNNGYKVMSHGKIFHGFDYRYSQSVAQRATIDHVTVFYVLNRLTDNLQWKGDGTSKEMYTPVCVSLTLTSREHGVKLSEINYRLFKCFFRHST